MEDQRVVRRESFDKGPCWVKMLISDKVAGGVIGKAGVVVNQIQELTNTHVKVAPNKNYFPSTQERALIISGQLSSIKKCMGLVIAKAVMCDLDQDSTEPVVVDPSEIELRGDILARLVVPNSAVSGIIGKAGEVIREIGKESGAYLRISDRFPGLQERTVTVTGKIFEVINASENVITRVQDDRNLRDHLNVVYQDSLACKAQGRFLSPEAPAGHVASRSSSISSDATTLAPTPMSMQQLYVVPLSVTMDIPESISAFVTGQEGCHLRQIACQTASHLIATPKPGVLTVTISGPMQSVQAAHMLLVRRVIDAQTSPEVDFSVDESDAPQSVYQGGVPPTPEVSHVQPPASTEAASLESSPKYTPPAATWKQSYSNAPNQQMVSTMPYMGLPNVNMPMGSPVQTQVNLQPNQFPSFPMMIPSQGMSYPFQMMPIYGQVMAQS